MSGFSNAGRVLFTAACGKIRLPSSHVGLRHDPVPAGSQNGPVDLSPLFNSLRCLSISPVSERLKAFRVEEKMGIDPPPPKPMGPYLMWAKENRSKLAELAPKKDFLGVGQYMGKLWASMPDDQKKPYVQAYVQELADYRDKHTKYLASLTDEQKEAVATAKKEALRIRRAAKDRVATKKKLKELQKPKKPMSAFMLYAAKRRQELGAASPRGPNFKEQVNQMATEWRNMPAEVKAPYEKEYNTRIAKYRTDVDAWEERMISEGHMDMIRTSTRARLDEDGKVRRSRKTRRESTIEAASKESSKKKLPRSLEVGTPAQEHHSEKREPKKTKPAQ